MSISSDFLFSAVVDVDRFYFAAPCTCAYKTY